MRREMWWLRPLAGAAILGALAWRIGTGPFLDALRRVDGWSLSAAAVLAALTTLCCAWRWALVARGLGVSLPLRSAVAEYYRSQFLNVTLPGGVVGDVRRGVRRGRDAGDVGRGLRSVVWERTAGQVVLVIVALGAVLWLPSPMRAPVQIAALLLVVAAIVLAVAALAGSRLGHPALSRVGRTVVDDLRAGVVGRHTVLVVVASVGAVAGNVMTFGIAAHSAGVAVSPARLLPLGLVVMIAMAVPLSLAGWGPREGATAWAFGAAGLGVNQGVAVAVIYGVMVLVASLPGAGLLLAGRWGRRGREAVREPVRASEAAAAPDHRRAAHG
ncbi:lysylphosphatidylglycerol synthase transmembrane domain-containing protein [Intrasporangium mesophilum]